MVTTIAYVSDWLDELSGKEGQGRLSSEGEYGLKQIAEDADELFRLVGRILTQAPGTPPLIFNGQQNQFLAAIAAFDRRVKAPPVGFVLANELTTLLNDQAIRPAAFALTGDGRSSASDSLLNLFGDIEALGPGQFTLAAQGLYRALLLRILTAGQRPPPNTSQAQIDSLNDGARPAGPGVLLDPIIDRALNEVIARNPHFRQNGATAVLPMAVHAPPSGANPGMRAAVAAGLVGQIPARLATLQREVAVAVGEGVNVLWSIEPISPTTFKDQLQALKSSIRSDLQTLKRESEREDGPIGERVTTVLGRLGNTPKPARGGGVAVPARGRLGDIHALTTANPPPNFQTVAFESLEEALGTLDRRVEAMRTLFATFFAQVAAPLFGDQVARAADLLPVVVEVTQRWNAEMDGAGYLINERSVDEVATGSAELTKALTNERVSGELRNLLSQLKKVADLAR